MKDINKLFKIIVNKTMTEPKSKKYRDIATILKKNEIGHSEFMELVPSEFYDLEGIFFIFTTDKFRSENQPNHLKLM